MSDIVELTCDNARQQAQLDWLNSGQNIEVGNRADLPLSIEQLLQIDEQSEYFLQKFSGLTAHVYKIQVAGRVWNLKRKREQILVKNVDGQTSFLNEVQRRADFHAAHQQGLHSAVVPTVYASLQHEFMLSPWIEAEHPKVFTAEVLESLFAAITTLEMGGFFEWDFCLGNLLVDQDRQIRLYDFGYMYRFDPLREYNSNGLADPLFHGVERFETRAYFGYLLELERTHPERVLQEFALEKQIALKYVQRKYDWLKQNEADAAVLAFNQGLIQRWQEGLASEAALADLYLAESHRSMVLDLLDDLHGQSCTPGTLAKADKIIQNLTAHFALLQQQKTLFFGDEILSQAELLQKYQRMRQQAVGFQLAR